MSCSCFCVRPSLIFVLWSRSYFLPGPIVCFGPGQIFSTDGFQGNEKQVWRNHVDGCIILNSGESVQRNHAHGLEILGCRVQTRRNHAPGPAILNSWRNRCDEIMRMISQPSIPECRIPRILPFIYLRNNQSLCPECMCARLNRYPPTQGAGQF